MHPDDEVRTYATSGVAPVADSGLVVPGDAVGGYRIEKIAGAGGMGVVYRARDPELARTVALKLIAPEWAREPRVREMFVTESLAAAGLEHPHVLPVYRAGEDHGHLFIAMRFVDGTSLREEIEAGGRLPPGRAARLVAQVASALDAAHARGLVHRDVKPGNILISRVEGEDHAYLSDFGLAVPVLSGGLDGALAPGGGAGSGRFAGTVAYIAPEQVLGGAVDARTDVYALGCVLFHALTGRPPFPNDGVEAVAKAHLEAEPPAVSALAPDVPAGFDAVVAKALAKAPDERYQSAGALADAVLALRYDVAVLCDAGDTEQARALAEGLRAEGFAIVSLDTLDGDGVREGLRASNGCAVVVGGSGLGDWARSGLSVAYDLAARDRAFQIVAVLAAGAPDPTDPGLAFLAARPYLDLRAGSGADGHAALARILRGAPAPATVPSAGDVCPYRGLDRFSQDDAQFFVGREQETARALGHLRTSRFLAVFAPSGNGKSSLLHAGVLAELHGGAIAGSATWPVAVMTPGAHPLTALAAELGRLGAAEPVPGRDGLLADSRVLDECVSRAPGAAGRAVLVVDQLEEVFTLCADAVERTAFLDAIAFAAAIPGGRLTVVVAMRADFYPRLADHEALRSLVAETQLLLGPLGPGQLRRAIEEPARRAGLELEPGLTRTILEDVADRPGTLPLVEHLLLELWRRRRGRTLTLEAYAASGGVEGALARRANDAVASLPVERREVARRVLLRLIQPGEGTEDTRRRAPIRELARSDEERADVEAVVSALASERLVTTDRDAATGEPVVEVSHEALIRGWPELRAWIDEDREGLRLHRRLTEATDEWHAADRDEGALYRGARLAAWQDHPTDELNDREREFLAASDARADEERRSRRKRGRLLLVGAGVAAALIAAGIGVALTQSRNAGDERAGSLSRQLASTSVIDRGPDPELALLLAAAGYRAKATPQAEEALRQAAFESKIRGEVPGTGTVLTGVLNLGKGNVLIAGEDGRLRIWDTLADPRGAAVRLLGEWPGGINGVVHTRAGYVTGGNDGKMVLWPTSGGSPHVIGSQGGEVYAMVVRRDGQTVVAAGSTGVWQWNTITSRRTRLLTGVYYGVSELGAEDRLALIDENLKLAVAQKGQVRRLGPAQQVALSPDRRFLLVGTDTALERWSTDPQPKLLASRTVDGGVNGFDFTRSGDLVAVAAGDGSVKVFPMRTGPPVAQLRGHSGPLSAVAFTEKGRIASVGTDGTARVWDWSQGVPARVEVGLMPQRGAVRFLSADEVEAVDKAGAVWMWTARGGASRILPPLDGQLECAAVSPDGSTTVAGLGDGRIIARDRAGRTIGSWKVGDIPIALEFDRTGTTVAAAVLDGSVVELHPGPAPTRRTVIARKSPAFAAAFSPSGDAVASGYRDGAVIVTRRDGTQKRLGAHDGPVYAAVFTPDGATLVTASADRTIRVWDVATGKTLHTLRGHAGLVEGLALTPDGTRIVSAARDGIRVWDRESGALLWTRPLPHGALQVDANGADPRIAYYGAGEGAFVSDCDVCGSVPSVIDLVPQRTTRDLTAAERSR